MAKKKNTNSSIPRRKRLRRKARLHSAPTWLHNYSGKDAVKGYSKWYAVSPVCAIIELRMLGMDIPEERLEKARLSEAAKAEARQRKKAARAALLDDPSDSDDTFAFIVGYTEGGYAYGVTWEEIGLDHDIGGLPDGEEVDSSFFL